MQKKLLILIPLLFLHNSYAAELAAALIQNNVMIDQELKTQSRVPKLAALSLRSLTNTMFSKEFLRDYKKGAYKKDESNIGALSIPTDVKPQIVQAMLNNPKIWQYAATLPISKKELQKHMGTVIALSPDGSTLASASDDETIKIWNVDTGQCIKTLDEHTDWVKSVAFTPDCSTLASASYDETIKIWNVDTGQCIKTLNGKVSSVAFSPDGPTLASASFDKTICLWKLDSNITLDDLLNTIVHVTTDPTSSKN